jgi:glycosyltransferase involved in cell wall biosynthesis
VARLIDKKQPLFLLEMFRRVRAGAKCALVIVGTGPLEAQMREFVERWGVPDVTFAGFVNQSRIGRVYAAADIFVLTSKIHETWGIVVNEAMNFGLPLVVTDKVGSAVDLVEEGGNGYVVPHDDVSTFSARVAHLVAEPATRAAFGDRSREIVTRHTHQRAAEGVLEAVRDAVGETRWGLASGA